MARYIFITFAPIQSFIEKSRKLRDLYGASLILSYLSKKLIDAIHRKGGMVISPGLTNIKKGIPNRILFTGNFEDDAKKAAFINACSTEFINGWGHVLCTCRTWLEQEVGAFRETQGENNYDYTWKSEWDKWKCKTWEVFWGTGDSSEAARMDLENRKLARQWTAINWIGESSSLSGADAIAYPRMAGKGIDFIKGKYKRIPATNQDKIDDFYQDLFVMLNLPKSQWKFYSKKNPKKSQIEGKFLAENEYLNIPELVKRLITVDREDTNESIANILDIESPDNFGDIIRRASDLKKYPQLQTDKDINGHWTGWFMGDGDKMGDVLQNIESEYGENGLREFSEIVRQWGLNFQNDFPQDLGRVIYAGGDDFLGIVYSDDIEKPVPARSAYQWLFDLYQNWEDKLRKPIQEKYQQNLTVSVGFVWVAPGVPQRDVLQHCREAEKRSKSLGRDRVTIRIVFNNGQYVQWTTPWKYLNILEHYQDLEDGHNWTHIYQDLAHLKSRHGMGFGIDNLDAIEDRNKILDYRKSALGFFEIYFGTQKDVIQENVDTIFKHLEQHPQKPIEIPKATVRWIEDLISVGWHLFK